MKKQFRVLSAAMGLSLLASSLGCSPATVDTGNQPQKPSTGSTTGTGSTSGNTSGNTAVVQPSADSPITATHAGTAYKNGDTYLIPDNSPTAGAVALFSEFRERFTIDNPSDKDIQIESVELVGMGDVVAEEFILQDTPIGWRTDENPNRKLEIKDTVLPAATALDVYFRFYPVAGGERKAQVVVTHDGGKKFVLNLVGKGRPDGQLFSKGNLDFFKVVGSVKDELTSTLLGDDKGNLYFSANQKEILDKFSEDILVGSLGGDGSKRWLKIFNGPNKEFQPDPGQNNETGGNQHSMALGPDGMLYIMGSAASVKQNNFFYNLILKVNPSSGELVWGKIWHCAQNTTTAVTSSTAYGLAVDEKHVYVTGQTGDPVAKADGLVSLLALNVADGSLKYQKAFDPVPGSIDRGYAIKSDGKGNLYLGGLSNGRGFLARLSDVQSDAPQINWLKKVDMGVGSNVYGLDVDSKGDVYLSLDRRGAITFHSIAKVSAEGQVMWGKTYPGNQGDKNNSNFIKVIGETVYAGGRTGQSEYDGQMGDALFMKLSASDGKFDWGMFHFSGKGPDELAEHRSKGMALLGNTLYVGGQVYTGSMNHKRYQGYWYDATNPLEDYTPTLGDISGIALQDLPQGRVLDSSLAGKWVDAPEDRVSVQDAMGKQDGSNTDGEFFLSKFTLK
ncbi:MAG: hypothetical protein IV090_03030 [Candidatus Sericytochromatia bacterium]|nr:hypothetical protein [Candidatus Sericytochromatia bacterium]